MAACLNCGGPISKHNKFGYCVKNAECRRLYRKMWNRRHLSEKPLTRTCAVCGKSFDARAVYGWHRGNRMICCSKECYFQRLTSELPVVSAVFLSREDQAEISPQPREP